MSKVWGEFKEFAIKGNAIDLAIGVVIGAAFGQVVNSLVKDILNPILSILTGHVNFDNLKVSIFGQTVLYGAFLNALINFIIVAFAIFLIIKQMNRFRKKPSEAENTKNCPYCFSAVDLKATRCSHCTSQLT